MLSLPKVSNKIRQDKGTENFIVYIFYEEIEISSKSFRQWK